MALPATLSWQGSALPGWDVAPGSTPLPSLCLQTNLQNGGSEREMFLELEMLWGEKKSWRGVAAECRKACAEGRVSARCPRSSDAEGLRGSSSHPSAAGDQPGSLQKASRATPDVFTCRGELGDPTFLPWGAHPKQTYEVLLF